MSSAMTTTGFRRALLDHGLELWLTNLCAARCLLAADAFSASMDALTTAVSEPADVRAIRAAILSLADPEPAVGA